MFWELYQTSAIMRAEYRAADAEARVRQTERKANFTERDLQRLEARVDSLTIGCHAMWELLAEHTSLTTDDLQAKIEEIDLRDGRRDGKVSPMVVQCVECGRKGNSTRKRCLYCGGELDGDDQLFA